MFKDDKKKSGSRSLASARKAVYHSSSANCQYCRVMTGGRRCPLGHIPRSRSGQAHAWDRRPR